MRLPRLRSFDAMLTWAGGLIVAGLVVQFLTTLWLHALSFILFASVGGTLALVGMATFLYWLAGRGAEAQSQPRGQGQA